MNFHTIPSSQFANVFIQDRPLLDVRAPIEYFKGAFPHTQNLPLMTDNERAQVGTCYKRQGQQAAIKLGHQLVQGKIKQQRIQAWQHFYRNNPNGYFYCFRGGLRSQLCQQWMQAAGFELPFIEGGYKALRQFLIAEIDKASHRSMLIVCGKTGSGKTEYLRSRTDAIDLEGIANHRGSSFGGLPTAQPTQIDFENQLAVALLKHSHQHHPTIVLEDESHLIGRNAIPLPFYRAMQNAPIIVIEANIEERVQRILQDYVIQMHAQYCALKGEEFGFTAFSEYLLAGINKIKKRLGSQRHQQIQNLMHDALAEQQQRNSVARHSSWIQLLLEQYYDPMYEYQLQQRRLRISGAK